jgi:hypothetical protein
LLAASGPGSSIGDVGRYNRSVVQYYTADEANALLPDLARIAGRLRDQRAELVDLRDAFRRRERTVREDPIVAQDDVDDDEELRRLRLRMRGIVDQMQADVAWLDDRSIQLRDIPSGLLDLPAIAAGRQVWLCWQLGEGSVGFWHSQEEGFAGRLPLVYLEDGVPRA